MADIKPTTVPAKRLSASMTAASTSFKLDNILGWDGNALTSSDFGSIAYASLRNSTGTLLEIIEFDPTTIASASITINKRGLKFDGTDLTTEVAANKLSWVKGDTIVELGSHIPQLLGHYVDIIADQTISGIKTFATLPAISAGDPVADNDIARKAYVDSVVAGSFPADRLVVAGNAGETVADGEHIYFDETDNEWKLTDASTSATSEGVLLGVAQGAGTNGNAITGGILLKGLDNAQSGMTIGDVMYLSDTPGAISATPGTVEVNVGIAKSATELYFTPRFLHFLTENEQDALVGNLGTPSTTDKYVTQTGLQKGAEIFAADAEASDTYVITLSPVPTAYFTGMVIHFSANTANTGAATINVNSLGVKTIKKLHDQDLATGDIESGQLITLIYDGTNFQMQSQTAISPSADIQTFTSSGTWTKPTGAKKVLVQAWGAGGSGAAGDSVSAAGGGGGEYRTGWFEASDLGATETVTIGAGGVAVAAGVGAGTVGNAGADTTLGSLFTSKAGFGGAVNGNPANAVTGAAGGSPFVNVNGIWGAGVSAADGEDGLNSAAGAGSQNSAAHAGGDSFWGGAGGGNETDGAGGTSTNGGDGGAGNDTNDTSNATDGSVPGGGGGARESTSTSADSGAGAAGKMIVTTYF